MQKLSVIEQLDITAKYANKWVAISPDEERVVGSGQTLSQAISQAKKKGIKDPILTRIPKSGVGYIL